MPTSENLPEAIRLQLRKPKSWQWKLSTSKSSPHIVLPVIQLYDYKGQLLVETTDHDGGTKRKTWQSSSALLIDRNKANIKRTRSATVDQGFPRGFEKTASGSTLTNRADRNRQRNASSRSFETSREESTGRAPDGNFPGGHAIGGGARKDNGFVINRTGECRGEKGVLSAETSSKSSVGSGAEPRGRHRRSKSDDLYRRKLRYNSSEESIKRADADGYRKFITTHMSDDEPQQKPGKHKRTEKNGKETAMPETNLRLFEMTHLKPKRYTTRTSSAGTLVIPEESFRDVRRRIRMTGIAEEKNDRQGSAKSDKDHRSHMRQASDPTASRKLPRKSIEGSEDLLQRAVRLEKQRHPTTRPFNSDILPPENRIKHCAVDENHNNLIHGSEGDDWNFQSIKEKSTRKSCRRKHRKGAGEEGGFVTVSAGWFPPHYFLPVRRWLNEIPG